MSVLLQLNFVDSWSTFCSSSSRAAVTRWRCSCQASSVRSRACSRCSSTAMRVRADLGDGRLGLRSRVPCLRRDARLQPLEVGVPGVELCLDGDDERRPIAGDVRTERMLGNVDPRPQPLELVLDLARSLASRGAHGRLRIAQCVEVASNPRQTAGLRARLHAVDAAADLGQLVFDRGGDRGAQIEPPVSVFLTARRFGGADANALPAAAAVLPAQVSAAPARSRSSSAEALSPRASASLGEPEQRCRGRVVGEGDEEDLARLARALRRATARGPARYCRFGGARVSAPPQRCGRAGRRAWAADQRRLGRLGGGEGLPLELLGLVRISARERDRPEPGESERRVLAEPDAARELERAPVALDRRRAVLPSLGDPRLQQQPGDAKGVVSDRVRMAADRRRHRGDRRDVAVTRRRRRADDAARRDAPVVARRLERGRRARAPSRQPARGRRIAPARGRASAVRAPAPGEPQPSAASATARSPAASATSTIELLGGQVAQAGEQLDPQLHRSVIARGGQREIEEAPSLRDASGQAEVPRQRPEPKRDARVRARPARTRAQPRSCRSPLPAGVCQSQPFTPRAAARAHRRRASRSTRRGQPRAAASPPLSARRSSTYSRTESSMS